MTGSKSYQKNLTRQDRLSYGLQLSEAHRRRRQRAIDLIMDHRAKGEVKPETVAAFAWLFMETDDGRPIVPAVHHWLWLELLCNLEIRRLLIVAPPEAAKTTWVSAYIGTQIAFWPERPRIYGSSTGAVAARRTQAIRTMLTSPAFQDVFPEVQRAKGLAFEAHQWSMARDGRPHPGRIHPTLSAYGTDGPVTGSRAREAVGDDILDERNTRTAYMREHVNNWLHSSFLSRLVARHGRALIIGTSWHHDDPYARMRDSGSWIVCHMPLLAEGEDVYATITYPESYAGPRLGTAIAENVAPEPSPVTN